MMVTVAVLKSLKTEKPQKNLHGMFVIALLYLQNLEATKMSFSR